MRGDAEANGVLCTSKRSPRILPAIYRVHRYVIYVIYSQRSSLSREMGLRHRNQDLRPFTRVQSNNDRSGDFMLVMIGFVSYSLLVG